MFRRNVVLIGFCVSFLTSPSRADILPIELTPTDVGSANTSYFTTSPTSDPGLFLGASYSADAQKVDFNTAPDGALSEGLSVTNEYASLGVTLNGIRISSDIYGGNQYGLGYATEHNLPQIYTFSSPVIAVGIVNTSPDHDLVEFYSGPGATGTLLFSFQDQQGASRNYNIDRFVGGIATDGTTIGSFVVSNVEGDLELDELVFVAVPEPTAITLIAAAAGFLAIVRRRLTNRH